LSLPGKKTQLGCAGFIGAGAAIIGCPIQQMLKLNIGKSAQTIEIISNKGLFLTVKYG